MYCYVGLHTYTSTAGRRCQGRNAKKMEQPERPFDEALRILAGIIAEKHSRQRRGIGSVPTAEATPPPEEDIEADEKDRER